MATKKRSSNSSPNFWGMITSIVIASMNKGQLPIVLIFGLLCFMIYRMPQPDVTTLAFHLLDILERAHILGYVMFVVVSVAWFIHARWQRRIIVSEIDHVAKERDCYQKLAGIPILSTESRDARKPKKEIRK